MEAPESPKYSYILRGFNEPEPIRSGLPMDGERQRSQLYEEESRSEQTKIGEHRRDPVRREV